MKLTKKWLSILLALCLVLGLSACTAKDIRDAAETAAEIADALAEADAALSEAEPAQELQLIEDTPAPEPTSEPAEEQTPAEEPETPAEEAPEDAEEDAPVPDPEGWYTSKEDVALYLHTYGVLPENFITKNEARALGWSGGGLDGYADGKSIGGDRFGNYEGILPDGDYRECDIDTMHASSRGAKRLVYSSDGRIYYTEDHYESFTLLYGEE